MGYAGKWLGMILALSRVFRLVGLACFLGAIQAVAKGLGKEEMGKKVVIHTTVHIGTPDNIECFGLAIDIKAEGIDDKLLDAAHEVCLD